MLRDTERDGRLAHQVRKQPASADDLERIARDPLEGQNDDEGRALSPVCGGGGRVLR